jgi:hypothetical protein
MAAADVSDMRLGSRGLSFDSEVPSFPPSVQGMATNDRPVLAESGRSTGKRETSLVPATYRPSISRSAA